MEGFIHPTKGERVLLSITMWLTLLPSCSHCSKEEFELFGQSLLGSLTLCVCLYYPIEKGMVCICVL